ncbi:WD40-repeat-containing domain protein [Talaromyces proteolyticus]|uniref:WD40-repeat-containing domain protein n=1 Tax=Talaromyces proteolyticus TaxID=1131652 RepID=A0AAD4KRQ4_9EURO|nr:WD40-repeat-containing domain protein [Talaromyces proteolyticus]KAH8697691.1 WD40-repeat-containing domain protein [Talaromyces proteolyticus]
MEIAPYSPSKKSCPSTSRVFHFSKYSQATTLLLDNTITTAPCSSHIKRDSKHRSSTFPLGENLQSFVTLQNQAATKSTSASKQTPIGVNVQLLLTPARERIQGVKRRSAAAYLPARRSHSKSRNRDRFIPWRSDPNASITQHHIRKLPKDLKANEKLVRHQEYSDDPFGRRGSWGILPPYQPNFSQAPHMSPHLVDDQAVPSLYPLQRRQVTPRQVSIGGIWNVGGPSIAIGGPWLGSTDCQKGFPGQKSTTPIHIARYSYENYLSSEEEMEMNQSRLAKAFDVDLTHRQLIICKPITPTNISICPSSPQYERFCPLAWKDCMWKRGELLPCYNAHRCQPKKPYRAVPFCFLPTPYIKDDFYCSVLAYCRTSGLLAYAMMDVVYLWSTSTCGRMAAYAVGHPNEDYVTGLAFSSSAGQRSILAVATRCGYLYLWSTHRPQPRRIWQYPVPISCVAFKQTTTRRLSTIFSGVEAFVEDLAVGDQIGTVWYYCVESSDSSSLSKVTLLARIEAHHGCICGISWSPDGKYLATSGDDDVCLLFDLKRILGEKHSLSLPRPPLIASQLLPSQDSQTGLHSSIHARFLRILRRLSQLETGSSISGSSASSSLLSDLSSFSEVLEPLRALLSIGQDQRVSNPETDGARRRSVTLSGSLQRTVRASESREPSSISSDGHSDSQIPTTAFIPYDSQVHQFVHYSAVKAIAFAPWQPTLLATGGGMSDRTVHFYHTPSGSCLAKIYMWAQVTGLVWSTTRREIAVILGFPEPEHPFRVAVFAWPSCEQIAAIPWNIDAEGQVYPENSVSERALSAISIPNFKNPPFDRYNAPTHPEDECIAVASSDNIRFYRIWRKPHKHFTGSTGVLHSTILESLDGIENPGNEVIR